MVNSKIGNEHAPVVRTRKFLHLILNVPGDQDKHVLKRHPNFLPCSQGEGLAQLFFCSFPDLHLFFCALSTVVQMYAVFRLAGPNSSRIQQPSNPIFWV
jgi:hypothetical protein